MWRREYKSDHVRKRFDARHVLPLAGGDRGDANEGRHAAAAPEVGAGKPDLGPRLPGKHPPVERPCSGGVVTKGRSREVRFRPCCTAATGAQIDQPFSASGSGCGCAGLASRGSSMVQVVRTPSALSTVTVPPCAFPPPELTVRPSP